MKKYKKCQASIDYDENQDEDEMYAPIRHNS